MASRLRTRRALVVAATTLALHVCSAGAAIAQELKVMTSGAFTAPFLDLIAAAERATSHKITTAFGASMGGAPDSIPSRLERGEPVDVVIMAAGAVDELIKAGKIVPGSRIDLVRSSIGMAVRKGAPRPDISTVAALKATLLRATSVAYSASASGVYLTTELFPRLGVGERLARTGRRIESERVGTVVARGDAEIGFQQISELLPIAGIDLVGPLPADAQRVTVFSAGLAAQSTKQEAVRSLVAFLQSEAASPIIIRAGLEPIGAR